MSCKPIEIKEDLQCKNGVKTLYLLNASDTKIVNGELRIKRPYGKFKRTVYKFK